jgi:hypothetical protein
MNTRMPAVARVEVGESLLVHTRRAVLMVVVLTVLLGIVYRSS